MKFPTIESTPIMDVAFAKNIIAKATNYEICNREYQIRYTDTYGARICYHIGYGNLSDYVLCQTEDGKYVFTAQTFLLLYEDATGGSTKPLYIIK